MTAATRQQDLAWALRFRCTAGLLGAASFGDTHTLTISESKVAGCGWGGMGQLGPLTRSATPGSASGEGAASSAVEAAPQYIESLTGLHIHLSLPVVQVAAGELHR